MFHTIKNRMRFSFNDVTNATTQQTNGAASTRFSFNDVTNGFSIQELFP